MKRKLALLVTLAVILVIVKTALRRPPVEAAIDEIPMACIDRMFTAARQGDVASYVDCFSDPELQAIQRSLDQESESAAAESLRQTMTDLRGWAVVDPPADSRNLFQCSLVVERIYSGRVDRQTMNLIRISGSWKICKVEPSQATQPPVPYGTPITGDT